MRTKFSFLYPDIRYSMFDLTKCKFILKNSSLKCFQGAEKRCWCFQGVEKGCTGKKWVNEDHHYLHQANLISNVIQLIESYCSAWYLCLNFATSSLKSSFSSLLNLFLSDLLNSLSVINMLTWIKWKQENEWTIKISCRASNWKL